MGITIIAAMSENFAIGRNNQLLWHISEDLKRFKRLTTGKPVIMGRKTWESIGKALPNRPNIVITRQAGYVAVGAAVFSSLTAALESLTQADDIMIIGGGEIYTQALPLAQTLELTRVLETAEGDTDFPKFTEMDWQLKTHETHPQSDMHPPYRFETWVRR